MRLFDACALCLQRARDPMACQKGHLFCKECVLTDLGACLCLHQCLPTYFCTSCPVWECPCFIRPRSVEVVTEPGKLGSVANQ